MKTRSDGPAPGRRARTGLAAPLACAALAALAAWAACARRSDGPPGASPEGAPQGSVGAPGPGSAQAEGGVVSGLAAAIGGRREHEAADGGAAACPPTVVGQSAGGSAAACAADSDCVVVSKSCCAPCDGITWAEARAKAAKAPNPFCAPGTACPQCASRTPHDMAAVCSGGACVLARVGCDGPERRPVGSLPAR